MRERTTWNREEIVKRASRKVAEDPRAMNQDHHKQQPSADAYNIGGPSEFAEDVHSEADTWEAEYSGEDTARNEIGLPEFRADTFKNAADEEALFKKASLCVKVARRMLKSASESMIEDQALALMHLNDSDLIATSLRLASEDEEDEEDDDSQAQAKQASDDEDEEKQGQEQQQAKQAQDESDDEEDDDSQGQGQQAKQAQQQGQGQQSKDDEESEDEGQQSKQAQQQAQSEDDEESEDEGQAKQAARALAALAKGDVKTAAAMLKVMCQGPMAQQQQVAQQQQISQEQIQQMIAQQVQQALGQGQQQQVAQGQQVQQQMAQGQQQMAQGQQQQVAQQQMEQLADDQLIDQMLQDDGLGQQYAADSDIQLEPAMSMDLDPLAAEDEVLTSLFASAEVQEAAAAAEPMARTASVKTLGTKPSAGVSKIGGAVSGAASKDVDKLSNLWSAPPDVSGVFRS